MNSKSSVGYTSDVAMASLNNLQTLIDLSLMEQITGEKLLIRNVTNPTDILKDLKWVGNLRDRQVSLTHLLAFIKKPD